MVADNLWINGFSKFLLNLIEIHTIRSCFTTCNNCKFHSFNSHFTSSQPHVKYIKLRCVPIMRYCLQGFFNIMYRRQIHQNPEANLKRALTEIRKRENKILGKSKT